MKTNVLFLFIIPGDSGLLRWSGNWVTLTDNMLQVCILAEDSRGLRLPTRIRSIEINPYAHNNKIVKQENEAQGKKYCKTQTLLFQKRISIDKRSEVKTITVKIIAI